MEETIDKRLIAYHEVGHALTGSLLEYHDPVEKVTIVPRGGARGLTWFTPNENEILISRAQLLARITMHISGRIVEEIVFGYPDVTTGATDDLQELTSLARQMVTKYGMSRIGPIALEDDDNNSDFRGEFANRVDQEVFLIIKSCEHLASQLISDNRVILDLAVEKLLEFETIEGDEFREIISLYTEIPKKKI